MCHCRVCQGRSGKMVEQHETFDVFSRMRYGASNKNTQDRCSRSKTITAAKEWKIVTFEKTNIDYIGALHLQSPKNRVLILRIIRLSSMASRFCDSIITFQKVLCHLEIHTKCCASWEFPENAALSAESANSQLAWNIQCINELAVYTQCFIREQLMDVSGHSPPVRTLVQL